MIGDIFLGHCKKDEILGPFYIPVWECNFFIMLLNFLKSGIAPNKEASQKKLFWRAFKVLKLCLL